MEIIYLTVIVSIVLGICFLGAFIWALRSGQYEDSYGPSVRILFDNENKDTQEKDKK